MKLINVDIDEFKKLIYPEYLKLFPKIERKSYKILQRTFEDGILKIIKIIDNDNFVGFIMTNEIKNNKYLQLDYLAILPQYQNKGYGTKALKLLKEKSNKFDAIFIEVEKLGLGQNEKENKLRKRRVQFYEKTGVCKLNFNLNLYNTIFTPYILQISNKKEDEDKIIRYIFEIYIAILGKETAEKNCSIIK